MARKRPPVAQSEQIDAEFVEEEEETNEPIHYITLPPEESHAPPQGPMARLNINTSIPVENLARLAAPAETAPAPAPVSTPTPTAAPAPEPDAAARYLEDVKRENKLRAYIYRMPDRLPLLGLPERLPKDRRGWVHYGSLPFNPDEFESEIQATFPPGNYWVDIREGGQFRAKEIISVAANPLQHADQPATTATPTQTPIQAGAVMPAYYPPQELPGVNPEKQFKMVLDLAKQLTTLQAPQPVPTLTERLEELKLLQKMLAPPPPPPQENPLERLVEVVQSEAFGQVKKLLRNPDATPATDSGWQGVIKEALPYLMPALAPLLQVLAVNAARNLQTQQQPAAPVTPQPPAPAAQSQPAAPPPAPAPASASAPPPVPVQLVEETEEEAEEEFNMIQQLVNDLSFNRAAAESAAEIAQAVKGNFLATAQIKVLIEKSNTEIWSALQLFGVPEEVLAGITWRDEWLDQLREALKPHFA